MAHHLGRETFLAPVAWSADGWPLINGNGTITPHMDVKTLPQQLPAEAAIRDEFAQPKLSLPWNFVRNLAGSHWSLVERPGWLRLKGSPTTLDDAEAPPVFVGRRQQYHESEITTKIDFHPSSANEVAGLALRMNDRHHYEFGIRRAMDGGRELYLRYAIGSNRSIAATKTIKDGLVRPPGSQLSGTLPILLCRRRTAVSGFGRS
jgi:alpha-N-arabinofuranosidase